VQTTSTRNIQAPGRSVGIEGAPRQKRWQTGLSGRALLDVAPLLLILLFALAFWSSQFGNPDVDFDEPFYLLVGERLLHGDIAYVDIWDRKPIGLFLI